MVGCANNVLMSPTWTSYEDHAGAYAALYESLAFETIHASILDLIPDGPLRVLDMGAGSGRDAAWFEARGHEVVACEPSPAMRQEAVRIRPVSKVRWLPDALPDLATLSRSGVSFDFILVAGVWMHVAPADRPRAFRKLAALLAPGGRLAISLRHGPDPENRGFHPVSASELEVLAANLGLVCLRKTDEADELGREGVSWSVLVFQLPDDATGALPLLRSIILRDRRSSSYKLALLRVLCRIAEHHPGVAREADHGGVDLPLGLVALTWLRAYLPLHRAGLPQHPQQARGFSEDLARLSDLDPQDLRPGWVVVGDAATALRASLRGAATTIRKMPVTYITYPGDGSQVFTAHPGPGPAEAGRLCLDEPCLWAFGRFQVPGGLWQALCRFSAWIDPLLRQAWADYMESLPESPHGAQLWNALKWVDPRRDTTLARALAEGLRAKGRKIHCVWSGKELRRELEIDHCFPMAVWPCQDLWNLLPAAPAVNNQKRDRLVSAALLHAAQDRILDWWDQAYLRSPDPRISERFPIEARMTLALDAGRVPSLEDMMLGVDLKRMALGRNREVDVWE